MSKLDDYRVTKTRASLLDEDVARHRGSRPSLQVETLTINGVRASPWLVAAALSRLAEVMDDVLDEALARAERDLIKAGDAANQEILDFVREREAEEGALI